MTHIKTFLAAIFVAVLCDYALATPGSYSQTSLNLTVLEQNTISSKPLPGGKSELTYSVSRRPIKEFDILLEALKRSLFPRGDFTSWKLVSVFEQNGQFRGFYAYNPSSGKSASLRGIVYFSGMDGAVVRTGKILANSSGDAVSGSLSLVSQGVLVITIAQVEYVLTVSLNGKSSLKPISPVAGLSSQWVNAPLTGAGNGYSSNYNVISGSVKFGAGVLVSDIDILFP